MKIIILLTCLLVAASADDAVIQWNNHFISLVRLDASQANPGAASRNGAILHLAIHDALASITGDYERYIVRRSASSSASQNAAVAAAARHVLLWLYPEQGSLVDSYYNTAIAAIPNNSARQAGIEIGERAADVVMAVREMDGSLNSNSGYVYDNDPLHWRPDPTLPTIQTAWGPGWGDIKLFNKASVSDFMLDPPPYTNMTAWVNAYNEVKSYGQNVSSTRTSDQLQIGLFWAYDIFRYGPPNVLFNQIAQKLAIHYDNTMSENARMFALLNMVMADAGIASWHFKYRYNLGRPVTVIRNASADQNPSTNPDPTWTPYGAPGHSSPNFTPPFPAYPSGHATFGGAFFGMLKLIFGTDAINIALQSDEVPGVNRTYTSFSQMSYENYISRVYLGIHYVFDGTAGEDLGERIANYTFKRFLQSQ